jgi:hypothetical protein
LSYPIECLDAGSGAARAHRDEIRELKIEVATLGSEAAELRAALAEARALVPSASTPPQSHAE